MRLLFIRFSAIGDIVLASPALRCAKQQIPGVEIHFLTKKSMKAVSEANPYVDRFHYFDKDLSATIQELKACKFDYIIDLHKNLRTLRIRLALGVPYLSYNKLSVEKFLLTKFQVNRMADRHISMRSVDTLAPLGVSYDGKGLDYFVPSEVIQPVFFPEGYVALVIGASYATKKLPLESLKVLCSQIPHPIVLVGGKEEVADGEALALLDPTRIVNTCGAYSLHESALIVSKARLVISHDTGMLYIACAFEKNVIAIWGATSPALQVEPFMPDDLKAQVFQSIVPDLTCQPCSNFGTKTCPKGHFSCMKQQDLPEIARQVEQMW
ncbi:glycosyltransferase family 9 protein [Aquirufa novilacunae]|jgi:ADP-heptose:LPS heptosyltransferase|uniref:Glycosyltransferase family 9 protein n=1 Tax=Aquirufa novilacunae TaxID=3139305 RepID=A0ABW8U0J2_9BACT